MQDQKAHMRKAVLQRRDTIPSTEREHKSTRICTQLVRTLDDLREEKTSFHVSVYQAMRSEVKLDEFIEAAYARGVRVCFPCMAKQADMTMIMREVSYAQYKHGHVPFLDHPMKAFFEDDPSLSPYPSVQPAVFNLIIVPLVAYDAKQNRLGYGGGNYDVFLRNISRRCTVVGVAFSEQEVVEVPMNSHDFPLPRVVVS